MERQSPAAACFHPICDIVGKYICKLQIIVRLCPPPQGRGLDQVVRRLGIAAQPYRAQSRYRQRRRLLEIAERCPVHRTLEGGADIVSVLAQPPDLAEPHPSNESHMRDMVDACVD